MKAKRANRRVGSAGRQQVARPADFVEAAHNSAAAATGAGKPRRRRPEPTPVQRALGLLTRREHSRKELGRKLVARGIQASDAEAAIDKLAEEGWQDDQRFAESLVRCRAGNGYGPLRIRSELGMHGLEADLVAEALEAYDGDWFENARSFVMRRHGASLEDRNGRLKAEAMLVRRGFTADQVRAAIRFDPDET